jgi:hypothetical protein
LDECAAGRAAGNDLLNAPALTMVPSAVPPASTICMPPLTVTSLLLSPADTVALLPLPMSAPLATVISVPESNCERPSRKCPDTGPRKSSKFRS